MASTAVLDYCAREHYEYEECCQRALGYKTDITLWDRARVESTCNMFNIHSGHPSHHVDHPIVDFTLHTFAGVNPSLL